MSEYSVTGTLPVVGRTATIKVTETFIHGDANAVKMFSAYINSLEGSWVGYPTGPGGYYGHAQDEFRIWWSLNQFFGDTAIFVGDYPSLPEIPPDAIP